MTDRAEPPPLHVELRPVSVEQKSVLANLLELYIHDFSEFHAVELNADGRFNYPHLEPYWHHPGRFPFLITVNEKLAGFVLVQQESQISGDRAVWDMAEFFIVRAYRRCGAGKAMAHEIWKRFPGRWEVRVMHVNQIAFSFWSAAIAGFVGKPIAPVSVEKGNTGWHVFRFDSAGRG